MRNCNASALLRMLLQVLVVAALATQAEAGDKLDKEEERKSDFYVNAGAGQVNLDDWCDQVRRVAPLDNQESSCDDTALGWSISGGWWINERWAVEAGYMATEKSEASLTAMGDDVAEKFDIAFRHYRVGAVARLPINDRFSVHATGGAHHWKIRWSGEDRVFSRVLSATLDKKINTKGTDLYFGGGAEYRFEKFGGRFSARGEWVQYNGDDYDTSLLSASIVLHF